MSTNIIELKGITWNHSRGFLPKVATAQRYSELHPNVRITWEKRSLQEFADKPIADLAEAYDFLVIDHPWAGFASNKGILASYTDLLPAEFLEDLANNSVGGSHGTYSFGGHQWALAVDAACPVSVYRKDLLERAGVSLPKTWEDLIALAKKGLVVCSSIPLDVYGNFLNLCVSAGAEIFRNTSEVVDREAGLIALEKLAELASYLPEKCYDINPIGACELMSKTDEFAYDPYAYGYSNYSRTGYSKNKLHFGDVVSVGGGSYGRTMLGGAGLAMSASCKHLDVAADYAAFMASPRIQKGIFYESGGQPGYRSVWLDEDVNRNCDDFFKDTLSTLDHSFVRPRYSGYLDFQDIAGDPIQDFLRNKGSAAKTLDRVNELYRENTAKYQPSDIGCIL